MTTDTDAQQPRLGEFDPRGWLSHFVGAGGGYHVAPDDTINLVWTQSGSTDDQQPMAKLMVESLSVEQRSKIDEWLISVKDFDPDAWLRRFERNGGWFMVNAEGKTEIFLQVYRNDNYDTAAEMQRNATPDQLKAVLEARLAQAERFDPTMWVVEFRGLGGTVHADGGHVFTGWKEEDPDLAEGAAQHRNRLIPSEVAKLRSYLYRKFDLPIPEEKAA